METKYIIAKYNEANNCRSFYTLKTYYEADGAVYDNQFELAFRFNSREDALKVIEYLGIGIFKIEEIYINNTL